MAIQAREKHQTVRKYVFNTRLTTRATENELELLQLINRRFWLIYASMSHSSLELQISSQMSKIQNIPGSKIQNVFPPYALNRDWLIFSISDEDGGLPWSRRTQNRSTVNRFVISARRKRPLNWHNSFHNTQIEPKSCWKVTESATFASNLA